VGSLGGEKAFDKREILVDKGEFLVGIHKHPRFRIEFYWDL
jgi:hypothetical protein